MELLLWLSSTRFDKDFTLISKLNRAYSQLVDSDEPMTPFAYIFDNVTEYRSSYLLTENVFTLDSLIDLSELLVYHGSLTVPNCYETMTWMVSTITMPITAGELASFRKLKDQFGDNILANSRPLQSLKSRKVVSYH